MATQNLVKRKNTYYIIGGIAVLLIGFYVYRNRYKFLNKDKTVLDVKSAWDKIKLMGGGSSLLPDNSVAVVWQGRYFYSNNRVMLRDKNGKKLKMGSYNMDNVKWDEGKTETLNEIFKTNR